MMLNRFVIVLILAPLAIVLIAFAVANRSVVALTFDPFNPGNPALTWNIPLFLQLFGALVLGLLIGGMATWFRQGQYRKKAKQSTAEVEALKKVQQNETRVAGAGLALPKPGA